MNCLLHSIHSSTTFLANSLSISILILFNSSVDQLGSFGGLICLGSSWKVLGSYILLNIMNWLDVISFQLWIKYFRRSAIEVTSITSSTSGSTNDLTLMSQFLTLSDCTLYFSVSRSSLDVSDTNPFACILQVGSWNFSDI